MKTTAVQEAAEAPDPVRQARPPEEDHGNGIEPKAQEHEEDIEDNEVVEIDDNDDERRPIDPRQENDEDDWEDEPN